MRIGLALPHYDSSLAGAPAGWESVLDVAATAEEAGFHSVWVSDHFFLDWGKYGGPDDLQGSLECWTTLAALAAATKKVRLGSLVSGNDFRNPGLLAKMVATLDVLSGGRAAVGLGAGWYEREYRAAGLAFDGARERIERLGEAVEIVRRLLAGEILDFKGAHYEMEGAICRPVPRQDPPPPVFIGGKGDRLIDTVARCADGWNFSWIGDIASYEERLTAAHAACERVGRDPASLRLSVGVYLLAGKDGADTRARFERYIERTPVGVLQGSSGSAAVSWEEFAGSRVAGTVAEVTEKLGRLAELGVQEAILTLGVLPFQLVDLEDVELVGSEIVPALGATEA
jgi:probable F420-dependent oxidoreductase